ncbi:hypothetical protein Q2K19_11030 [Micromonospora soli]|uniref:hypothetical protein n=1 Tax=Micromonospora sp. NBRC 110009 TaxID=3061627 RepID=UPI002672BC5A|nr:hypothetical protein [Micromonospora sp. NBRC 110009]WKU00968.1 hypothetical protein Q2K19_11030 [Micromonospora sp. NBRC 110009]
MTQGPPSALPPGAQPQLPSWPPPVPGYGPPAQPGQPAPYPGGPGQAGFGPYAPQPPPAPKSRRGLWIGVGVGVLALTLCAGTAVGVGVGLTRRGEEPPKAAAAANGVSVTQQELDELLNRHSKALADKDLKAYLTPFDPARKELVASQTQLFRNLGKLPLAVGRYGTVAQQGRTSDSFGRGVTFQLDVSFVHQFDGYDLTPVAEWYRWTVVKESRDAPIKVTAVTGAPAVLGDSKTVYYPGPWDKWPDIHVEQTPHTLVITDARSASAARRYAPVAEAAVRDDLAAWQSGGATANTPKGFVIALVKGKKDLGSLYRINKEKTTESGISIGMISAVKGDIDIGGSRIVIDVADQAFFAPGDKKGPREIFRHELAHSLVATLEDADKQDFFAGIENWIVEGFAEYLAHRGEPLRASGRTAQARALLRSGWDGKLPDNFDWSVSEDRLSFHYWLGHAAMTYLADTYGEQKLFQFVVARYQGATAEQACQRVLGVPLAQFQTGWAAYVRAQAR